MDPLLHHLGTAAWLWLPIIGLLGILHLARAGRGGSTGKRAGLAVAATCAWLGLVVASASLGAAIGGRPGLMLALVGTMLLPFAALAHPRVRSLVEPRGAMHHPLDRWRPNPAAVGPPPVASTPGSNPGL